MKEEGDVGSEDVHEGGHLGDEDEEGDVGSGEEGDVGSGEEVDFGSGDVHDGGHLGEDDEEGDVGSGLMISPFFSGSERVSPDMDFMISEVLQVLNTDDLQVFDAEYLTGISCVPSTPQQQLPPRWLNHL